MRDLKQLDVFSTSWRVKKSCLKFLRQNFKLNLTRRHNSTRRGHEISQRRAVTARNMMVLVIQRFTRFHGVSLTAVASSPTKYDDRDNDHT